MPSNVLKGKVAIFGIAGTVTLTGTGIIEATNLMMQGAPLRQQTEEADLADSFGDVRATTYHSEQHSVELEMIPFDATGASDITTLSGKVKLPAPGSKVTLAGFAVGQLNGDWNYSGKGSITPAARGYLRMTMTLTRKDASGGSGPVYLA